MSKFCCYPSHKHTRQALEERLAAGQLTSLFHRMKWEILMSTDDVGDDNWDLFKTLCQIESRGFLLSALACCVLQ